MPGIFRNFRKHLPEGQRVTRYLIYAAGEIVLLVIGILIALQVNTWNEEARDRRREEYYLNSVKTSIALSRAELDRVTDDAGLIASSADTLFAVLAYRDLERLDGDVLDSLLYGAADWSVMSLNDGGIREVLNTGSLDIIRNNEIRIALASWDERLHKIRKFEEETGLIAHAYLEYLDSFVDASLSLLDSSSIVIPEKRDALLSDPQLRNYLAVIGQYHTIMYRRYASEKHFLDSLEARIDEYLLK